MARIVYPPNGLDFIDSFNHKVFLAGSIEMGLAEDWQERIAQELADIKEGLTLYNPRRKDWDSSWEQKIENPQFNEQVNWELDNIEKANSVIFYFDPNTKSPITLMELGLIAGIGEPDTNVIVCCPNGYWRKGNVDIICERSNFISVDNLDDLVGKAKPLFERIARVNYKQHQFYYELDVLEYDELLEQINTRHKLLEMMVGTLYPSIVKSEIVKMKQMLFQKFDPNGKRRNN